MECELVKSAFLDPSNNSYLYIQNEEGQII